MAEILITGGERGLGLALVRAYTDAGDTVTVLCRESSSELDALAPEIYEGIDIANAASIHRAAAGWGDRPLDVLINNAGIMIEDDLDSVDVAAARQQFEVNALGPLNIALAFRKRIRRSGKLINISSRLGSIGDNGSGDDYGYRMSKAAQNMLTANLAHDLAEDGVIVAALHPGIVATGMTGGSGTPADAVARDLKRVIGSLGQEMSGGFFTAKGESLPW